MKLYFNCAFLMVSLSAKTKEIGVLLGLVTCLVIVWRFVGMGWWALSAVHTLRRVYERMPKATM